MLRHETETVDNIDADSWLSDPESISPPPSSHSFTSSVSGQFLTCSSLLLFNDRAKIKVGMWKRGNSLPGEDSWVEMRGTDAALVAWWLEIDCNTVSKRSKTLHNSMASCHLFSTSISVNTDVRVFSAICSCSRKRVFAYYDHYKVNTVR